MFNRFTAQSKSTMNRARQEAQRLHHEFLSPEHMLLGLLGVEDCSARAILRGMDIDAADLYSRLDQWLERGPSPATMGQLPFTPEAKRVLELSMDEAARIGHNHIGTEHLLLGLASEGTSKASKVLANAGAKLEIMRVAASNLDHVEDGSSMPNRGPRAPQLSSAREEKRSILGEAMRILIELEEFELAARLRDVLSERLSKE
jgi:ATP-dependent Clp protease ATP-binding subunit ClpC